MEPIKNDPQAGKTVWVHCRAVQGCTGRQALIRMRFALPTGGTVIRYKCLTCNRTFHATF